MMKSRRPSIVTALIEWLPAPLNVRSDCPYANHQRRFATSPSPWRTSSRYVSTA